MAQGVLETLVRNANLGRAIGIDSAGTHGMPGGAAPDPRAARAAAARGYDISHLRSRVVRPRDFADFDYILAMDRANFTFLEAIHPPGGRAALHLFLDFARVEGEDEVPDPYYGNMAGFERVLDLCELAGGRVIGRILRG
jgi:protein-tyrosine phosphatase